MTTPLAADRELRIVSEGGRRLHRWGDRGAEGWGDRGRMRRAVRVMAQPRRGATHRMSGGWVGARMRRAAGEEPREAPPASAACRAPQDSPSDFAATPYFSSKSFTHNLFFELKLYLQSKLVHFTWCELSL
jgi:hypothetical protein